MIVVDPFRYGRGGFNWRKLAWALGISALLGFLTAIMTNFHEVSWAVFFIVLYLEFKLK